MFCKKCGEKNKENSKFCISCGSNLTEETSSKPSTNEDNKIKVISIIGVILCFIPILNIIGLILAIIGLIMCSKFKKKNGTSSNYFIINIIGLIISIIETLIIIFVTFCVILAFKSYNNSYIGKWNCSSYEDSLNYAVETEFKKDGTFTWARYNDAKNNSFTGTYTAKLIKSNNRDPFSYEDYDNQYDIDIKLDGFLLNGKNTDSLPGFYKNLEADMYIDDDESIIYMKTTNKKLYCKRVNSYLDD